jgi:photosystem II stability/assembly factor-like uncharacterized protein
MKYCFVVLALLISAQISSAQNYSPLLSVEPPEQLSLHRDSERWIQERFRWFREQRLDPDGTIPEGVREQAWRETQHMSLYKPSVRMGKSGATSSGRWVELGPVNIGGRITGIAIHPTNPDLVYFTAADGGVWKSVNGTSLSASFVPVSDDLPTMATGSIDIDPNNPDIVYLGSGEANGSADSYPGVGVIRSTDAGATWEVLGGGVMKNIGAIRVHRTKSNIINAASRQGLYQSLDSGRTWKQTGTGMAHDLVSHPTIDSLIYAGVQGQGVLKSTDGGTTWKELNLGVVSRDSIGRIKVDLCLTQPNIVYAVLVQAKGPNANKTYAVVKSTDNGDTWVRTTPVVNPTNFFSTYGWYNCEIGVHPTDPNKVLIGGVQLYLSLDGCKTFSPRGGVHVDQHAIEFSPTAPDICYLGNDGGMYVSGNGGITFSSLNANLPITQFYELGIAAQDPTLMMGGTQDNGSNTRHEGNELWVRSTGGDGGYCVFDYTDLNYRYAEYQNGSHLRSTNGGKNWVGANKGLFGAGPWVTPVAIHPVNPTVLFTCTNKQLYKTTNRAENWFPFHGNMDSSRAINYIAISPKRPEVMLVGYTDGKIYRSTNSGADWTRVSTGTPSRNVTDIIFDPVSDSTYYVSFSGYVRESVFKTTDGGSTWTSIAGNLPAIPTNALEINPHNADELYVGTDFGVYATTDGGGTWQILGEGMPKVVVVDLELHPVSGQLMAATHGRSIYGLTVTTSVELVAFSASRAGSGVDLTWRTGSTAAIRGFAIERALDGGEWNEIAYVEAEPALAVRSYNYSDREIPAAANSALYRLKQSRYDGGIEYSSELQVNFRAHPEEFTLEQNYPNPFNPGTTIRYQLPHTGQVRLYVTDVRGSLIRTLYEGPQYQGTHLEHFDASSLSGGSYFYHLEFDGKRSTKSMMFIK